FHGAERLLGRRQGWVVAAGSVICGQAVKGEGVQVNMLAPVRRLAGVGDLRKVTAVRSVAELAFEKIETGLGRGEGALLLGPSRRQGTEEPELPGLQREELLAGRPEPILLKQLVIAAVCRVHASGQVEVDDTRLEDLSAAACLSLQAGLGGPGRHVSPGPGSARCQEQEADHADMQS